MHSSWSRHQVKEVMLWGPRTSLSHTEPLTDSQRLPSYSVKQTDASVDIAIVTRSTLDRHATDMSIDCRPRVHRSCTNTDYCAPRDENLSIHCQHFTVISPALDRRSVVRQPIYIGHNAIHISTEKSVMKIIQYGRKQDKSTILNFYNQVFVNFTE